MSGVISDKNVIRAYALIWTAAYLTVYFFLKNYLPEEYFRDSQVIERLASTGADEGPGAFQMAAIVARLLTPVGVTLAVAAVGVGIIWVVMMSLRTMRGMVYITPVLAPLLVLNTMAFGKETFVIPMTYLLLWWTTRTRSAYMAFFAITVAYVAYALFFREYYFIILAVFLGCIILRKTSTPLRIVFMLAAMLSLFVIPSHTFMDIQGDRDRINRWANMYFTMVHTAIYNPVTPDSAVHFMINYAYAAVRLTLPFLFRRSLSDWILFINVVFYSQLIYTGLKTHWGRPLVMLPLLFIAHALVLFMFEPDLGSYLRHISSVILYLLPSLRIVEQQRIDKFERREAARKEMMNALPQRAPVSDEPMGL